MTAPAGWYPVALGRDVEPGTATGTRLFGQELAVWRGVDGAAHVWEDRCPHRGMRLSFGFVRGGRLACLYHGWQFDGDGRCRAIPAHPSLEVPATITVRRFEAAERLGMVWVRWGDGDQSAPAAPGGDAVPVRSVTVEAPLATLRAALDGRPPPAGAPDASTHPYVLRFRVAAGQLHAALQPREPASATLHVVLTGTPGPGELRALSRWAEAVRGDAEGAAA